MKLIFFCLAVTCIVGINCFSLGLDDHHGGRGAVHETASDMACASAQFLQQAGWLNSDGTQSRRLYESESAKECRDLIGENTCDTSDKILSCLRHRGLATAINVLTFPVKTSGFPGGI